MDFELGEEQRAILEAIESLLSQRAGAARAIELAKSDAYDHALDASLAEAGFTELALGPDTGLLEATLLVEAVARAGGVVAIGAGALVAPALLGRALDCPIAIASADAAEGPIRFGAHAKRLLVLDGADARVVELLDGEAKAERSSFGFPMGRVPSAALRRGDAIGAKAGARLASLWRLALAAEAAGAMRAALDVTLDYVKRRRQFGRAIGSFQAVQHRLAECHVWCEGARWLALEAAFHDADAAATATAATHALAAAERVFAETHQLSGAMGYTREHDLHVFSMRLPALRFELGGVRAHRRMVAIERWG